MSIYLGSNKISETGIIEKSVPVNKVEEFLTRTISTYSNSLISTIGSCAFAECSSLTEVDIINCKYINASTFQRCSNLSQVNVPSCSRIYSFAFYGCTNLPQISFPLCTIIYDWAFAYCSNLTSISFPSCTNIYANAFISCKSLLAVDFPQCSSVGYDWLFAGSTFYKCTNLTEARFPICTSFYSNTFANCYNLISLYLNSVSTVTTIAENTFNSTPIGGYSASAGRYGSVFVPASLYNDFIVASYWSDIADRIVSV